MRTLRFYGASDDRFEIEGSLPGEPDEIGCHKKPCVVKVCSPSEGQLAIVGIYAHSEGNPRFCIGILPKEEDDPIPPRHMAIQAPNDGSPQLTILVPDDAVVSEVTD